MQMEVAVGWFLVATWQEVPSSKMHSLAESDAVLCRVRALWLLWYRAVSCPCGTWFCALLLLHPLFDDTLDPRCVAG